MIDKVYRIMLGDRLKLMVRNMRQKPPRELHRTQSRICNAVFGKYKPYLVIEKSHIEPGIVRDKDRIADELKEFALDVGKMRSLCNHIVVDAREFSDEARDRLAGVYERVKIFGNLAVLYSERADLCNAVGRRLCTGRFEIKYDELGIIKPAAAVFRIDKLNRITI